MKKTILVIDDEAVIRKALERFFTENGYQVLVAASGEEGLALLNQGVPEVVLVDLKLPKMSGVEFLRKGREKDKDLVVIVITGHGTIPSAVEAIREGAFYYVTKPFDLEELSLLVGKAMDHRKLCRENQILKEELKSRSHGDKMVGKSQSIREVMKMVEQVAKSDSTVLILGESGTGKELVAKAIHHRSDRAGKPLVIVNCAAIPENLLESELFGHEKGAFTGAVSSRPGRFENAHGGTIFLDEIGDMSPNLQVKILRVLQDHQVQPIGSAKSREVDVRVIAATNQNLEEAVKEGKFREDLYYRLNVIPLHLAPLRERTDDIPLLLEHFLKKATRANQKLVVGFSPEAMKALTTYSWPGNVRELENLVERLVILKGEGRIEMGDLPPPLFARKGESVHFNGFSLSGKGVSFRGLVAEFERDLILKALKVSGGNRNKAASLLQLNRTTLIEKMRKCRLEKQREDLHGTASHPAPSRQR